MPTTASKSSRKSPVKKRKTPQPTQAAVAAIKTPQPVLPGYFAYTRHVVDTLLTHKQVFVRLMLLAWALLVLGSATAEYSQYGSLSEATHEAVNVVAGKGLQAVMATWILFSSVLTGSLTSGLSEGQNTFRTVIYLMLWLVVVWLLRHLLAQAAVKVRDGLYNAGAPFISALIIILVGIAQLLPLALLVSLFAALINTGALNQAIIVGLMVIVSLVVAIATLYWLTSTFFAFIVVTIPGTYPLTALRSARKVIAGYRITVLLRVLWLGLVLFVVYSLALLPFLYLDAAFHAPVGFLVVAMSQLLGVIAVMYGSAYIYIMYRKVIDGRAE